MTDISGAMEAARRIVDWDKRTAIVGEPSSISVAGALVKDALTIANFLLSSHPQPEGGGLPQRDGEGNRGSEPQVPAPRPSSAEAAVYGPLGYLICYGGAGNEDEWLLENDPDIMASIPSLPLYALQSPPGLAVEGVILRPRASPSSDPWQPISTAPKGELIDIWIKSADHAGTRWADCYYDRICSEWRTSRPSGHLISVPERVVTHWRPRPAPPGEDANQQSKTEEKS